MTAPNTKPSAEERCTFTTPDGRRCTQFRAAEHDSLCLFHWRAREKSDSESSPESAAIVARVLGSRKHFNTATDVNDTLGKLFSLRARKLISLEDAHLLAYVSSLLLFSLQSVRSEFLSAHNYAGWEQLLRLAIPAPGPSADPPAKPHKLSPGATSGRPSSKRGKKRPAASRESTGDAPVRVSSAHQSPGESHESAK